MNTNPWLLLALVFLSFTIISEGSHGHGNTSEKKKLPSAMVVGTVFCDTCSQHSISKTTHFISGASVAVECKDGNSRFYQKGETNEHGEFKVHLPLSVAKSLKKAKACSVELLSSSEPLCAVISTKKTTTSPLQLKGRNQETHIFSAGFFTFRPLKQPDLCQKNPNNLKTSRTQIHQGNPNLITPKKQFIGSVFPPLPIPTILSPPQASPLFPPLPLMPPIFGLPPIPGLVPGLPLNPLAPPPASPTVGIIPLVPKIAPVIGVPPLSASSSSVDKP